MANRASSPLNQIQIGGIQAHFQNVRLGDEIMIDELHFEGSEIDIEAESEQSTTPAVNAGECRIRLMISEPNLNTLLASRVPQSTPIQNLKLALLSGKVRITGNFVKSIMHLPFALEAVPQIEFGTHVKLDFRSARIGITLPAAVVDVLEQIINNSLPLDLSRLPFPVRLDEIRCEPGRLYASGRARLVWPLAEVTTTAAPFTAGEIKPLLSSESIEALPRSGGNMVALPPPASS